MQTFLEFSLKSSIQKAIDDLGFVEPTPIQQQVFSIIKSGQDIVGIAQTGTGKTLAYLLPVIDSMKYSKEIHPKILIVVPTRELVLQVAEQTRFLTKYMTVRIVEVYGGTNINTQKKELLNGADIIIATPGRLYDLALSRSVQLKSIKKVIIDEIDVMLDLGFRFQLNNIFDLLNEKRQNIMFSATMTEDVETLINNYFVYAQNVSVAVSGTPLKNILQTSYKAKNFYTKINLLKHLLADKSEFSKVLVFVSTKRNADRIFEKLHEDFADEISVIHSNKTQNYRIRSVKQFETGDKRILITTDVMSRGLDISKISHVVSVDTPLYPENYMHRIGRTGRAKEQGNSILLFTEKEIEAKKNIENLMNFSIPVLSFPEEVEQSNELIPEEVPRDKKTRLPKTNDIERGDAFHEKKDKNKKINLGGTYRREISKKYKKPKTKGDKNFNKKKKRRK